MKICIYSGTFNPIHNAHINLVNYISKNFDFDKILVIPNNIPPHKKCCNIPSAIQRLAMLKLVFENNPKVDISSIEINNGGKSFSYNTIITIKNIYNIEEKVPFIIGTDAFLGLPDWHKFDELIKNTHFLVAPRAISIENQLKNIDNFAKIHNISYEILDIPFLDISSSNIRKLLKKEESISNFIPSKLEAYIKNNNLYKKYSKEEIKEILQKEYNCNMKHCLAVAQMAEFLAQKFGEDPEKAYITGLLHDCVKYIGIDKIKEIQEKNQIEVLDHENDSPRTLHAPVGAFEVGRRFNIEDEEILSAIRFHTIAKPDMSTLEKIVFIADKIEPVTRDKDFRAKIEPYLEQGLNQAIKKYMELLIEKLEKENIIVCDYTKNVCKFL